ncbi:MAG: hypothetical protein WBH09_03895 [Rugosibacter sp.]
MAKPNYSYEKRQRDLAKKQKKEDKRIRKQQPLDSAEVTTPPEDSTTSQTPEIPPDAT